MGDLKSCQHSYYGTCQPGGRKSTTDDYTPSRRADKICDKKSPQILKTIERRKITQTKRQKGLKALYFTEYTVPLLSLAVSSVR